MEREKLIEKIENGEGTIEEAEHWLALLEEQDPYFRQSDRMLSLEDMVHRRRGAAAMLAEMDSPPTPAQIAHLLESLDYSRAENREDIDAMDAREEVIDSIFPHPDTRRYLDSLLADGAMTTEEAVTAALAYQPKATFHLPGTVDENWRPPHVPEI
jgi:hypothetical protein